jgi:NADH-quinone oxidoreductase chain I
MGRFSGFLVTLRQMGKPRLTTQYPKVKHDKPERLHGRHVLNRYEDGMEKCIGCELCAGACPVGCIYVGPAENDPANPVSPGERYAARYEINLMRCIYCGYCAEACPTEAITLGPRFELADYRRERLVATKEDLLEAWPGFDRSQRANPLGAGGDQRQQPGRAPGVSPRLAWDRADEVVHQGGELPVPGHDGLMADVPSVAEPAITPQPTPQGDA